MLPVFIVAFVNFLKPFCRLAFAKHFKQFNLKRTKGILGGAIVGFIVVFILATVVFGADSQILRHLPKDSLDLIEGWLFTLSSLFVAYAVFSLHKILSHYQQEDVNKIESDVTKYKLSLLAFTIQRVSFVFKEGCEGIFFNVTNGLFYTFSQDLTGFGLAFIAAMTCGLIIRNFLTLVSLKRIFRITEVFIIFVGVDAITEGLETLATYYFNIDISDYDMLIALLYVIFVYEVFIRDDKKTLNKF